MASSCAGVGFAVLGILGVASCLPATFAQSQPAISYVASIKPNRSADPRGFSEYLPGGRFTATAITVRQLLRNAYGVQPYQLTGAPDWISTARFDIEAKVEDPPAPAQQTLLRALLKDRFELTVHNETRQEPVFALVLARSDGKLGPHLVKSSVDCAAYLAGPHSPEPGRTPQCGANVRLGILSGRTITMAQLATALATFANRFTRDKTDLPGGYDVELTWAPDPVAGAAADSTGPSLFSALQEQLGLKLISEKGPVDLLVVDHIQQPSEN